MNLQRRWLLRAGLTLLVVVVGLVALAPTLFSQPGMVNRLTERATKKIAGSLSIKRLRLRWFAPAEIDGVQFADPQGRPVLEVEQCRGERSLLKLLTDRSTFGELRFVEPKVYLLLDENGNNVGAAVQPKTEREFIRDRVEDLKKLNDQVSGQIQIVDGSFVFQSAPDRPKVEIAPLNVQLAVHPNQGPNSPRRLELQPGRVFEDVELTRDLCNDLIKFVAPVLARNSWVEGSVSLTVEKGSFPVKQLDESTLTGQLTVHEISAGAGPIVAKLAEALELKDEVRLVDESVIQFELADRHVIHRGLRFEIGRVGIETEGSVGFDESVNLIANIVFPEEPQRSGELAKRLAGRRIQIPITGSIGSPQIDWRAILNDHPFLDEFIERVVDPNDTPILDTLRDIRQRRQQRLERADPNSSRSSQNGNVPVPILRDRPVARRLLQSLLKPDNENGEATQKKRESPES